eukprot:1177988-Prorocentrum_minimum.AAC.3
MAAAISDHVDPSVRGTSIGIYRWWRDLGCVPELLWLNYNYVVFYIESKRRSDDYYVMFYIESKRRSDDYYVMFYIESKRRSDGRLHGSVSGCHLINELSV